MKTFKLRSLQLLESHDDQIEQHTIDLLDGLIINREDDQLRWVIEAYVSHDYFSFLNALYENQNEIIIRAKITKKSNEPATFITKITGINEIGNNMNVLFIGTLVDRRMTEVETLLSVLSEEGYKGKALLSAFKKRI
ncbi:YwpF family protein [Oceanobacillus kapialis]|uniref:YwpF family protein n=1 Tax=Oceanobacillus kapialis TaxID=481353 RepID=UPI00384B2CBF